MATVSVWQLLTYNGLTYVIVLQELKNLFLPGEEAVFCFLGKIPSDNRNLINIGELGFAGEALLEKTAIKN